MTVLGDPSDAELKARHRAMWAMGDYPAVAADVIPNLGSALVEACGIKRGETVLDVACGSGNAAIPAALARRARHGLRPHPGAARNRSPRSRIDRRRDLLARGRRRITTVRRRHLRCRRVLRRGHVRLSPPGQCRRVASRLPSRRQDRPGELDPRRLRRPDVRHHEALLPASATRRPAPAPMGQRRPRPRPARQPSDRHRDVTPDGHRGPLRVTRCVPRLLQGQLWADGLHLSKSRK